MFGTLPGQARALLWIRVINQMGAYALAFLAVLAGPKLAPAVLISFGIAALISRWIGGLLLDRFAPRTVVALGLFSTGTAMALLAAAHGATQLVAASALVGLAFELYEPATQELLARVTSGDSRQDAYRLFGTSLVASGAVGGLIAAVLLPLGVRWLVAVDALSCIAAGVLTVLLLEGGGFSQGARGDGGARWRPPMVLVRVTLACTAFAFGYLAVLMFMPFILLQRGAPGWLPGVTLTSAALIGPVAAHLTRRVLNPRSHGFVLSGGAVVLGALTLLMALSGGVVVAVLAYLGWAVINSAALGRWQALVADLAPEAERPRWFAMQGSSWGVAQPVVPLAVAVVAGIVGGTAVAAPLTGGLAFLAVPLLMGVRRSAKDSVPDPAA
ncbi:MFS transporter [Actinomadura barringtoniae]|uniref:MFS transporter n=1 Tax=Actinomadura barringtoniae TaxID=1427535 RepID=A0A939T9X4_9ACTN|nr:MFS transporter [Actinomadura barringtoniae]MBO2454764.1 MFS transporter [Actinomadura barringtoniae]